MLKCQTLRLSQPVPEESAAPLRSALLLLMGVEDVRIQSDQIVITYDLLQVNAALIESTIGSCGIELGHEWPERLRRAWVHYSEEDAVTSREVPQGGAGGGCH